MRIIDADKLEPIEVGIDEMSFLAVDYEDIKNAPTIEPCEDAISRRDAIKEIRGWFQIIELNPDILIDNIKCLPSVAPSRPSGEWLGSDGDICCSNCGAEAPLDEWEYKYRDKIRSERTKYCPNCGAKMK